MTEVKRSEGKFGKQYFEISNENLRLKVCNLGCHIMELYTKDRNGNLEDIVLGYRDVEQCHTDLNCVGSVVGRVANRIASASFQLNGITYELVKNDGNNSLHGGDIGFNQKLFESHIIHNGVTFTYVSPDGEQGFPGTLTLTVTYEIVNAEVRIRYFATTDADTLINVTNHAYFNLSAGKQKIYDHRIRIAADRIACISENGLPEGEFLDVTNTPFDFVQFHTIGERIHDDHIQLKRANGYDHGFLLNKKKDQIYLEDDLSGRRLVISTDMPVVQMYTANYLNGTIGKEGKVYEDRDGVALETQFLSNSIHYEKDSPTVLRKNKTFHSQTVLRFETFE